MEMGGDALLKVLSNEYQDKEEKYETDVIELGDVNFFSEWFVKSQTITSGKEFEILMTNQHEFHRSKGRKLCASYLR